MEDDTVDPRFARYYEAYLEMAREAKYRPGAPSDQVLGHVLMSEQELRDPAILDAEATKYAMRFLQEDECEKYPIGCPDFRMNKAFFFAIAAARIMCGSCLNSDIQRARKVLELAIKKLDDPKGD